MSDYLLKLEHITKRFGEELVLKQIDFTVYPGEYIAIMGQSGCGKTTLLNIIGFLDSPNDGKYYVNGEDLLTKKLEKSSWRNQMIGFVFQMYHLIEDMTVLENIYLPFLYSKKKQTPSEEARIDHLLHDMNMDAHKSKKVLQLSGGEKQRVAILRALAMDPTIIIADEPTGNLDEENTAKTMQLFDRIHQMGKTIVMVTHSLDVAKRAQRIYELKAGELIAYEA